MESKVTTLAEGIYRVPEGYRAFVVDGNVVIAPKSTRHEVSRCRDCKHCIRGKHSLDQDWISDVCDLKPKMLKTASNRAENLFYAAVTWSKACDKFEPKL